MEYSNTWLTPPDLLSKLGRFDTDPCCPENMPWSTAKVMYTKEDDGLACIWYGRVWLNPPYQRKYIDSWMRKMADHNNGIALLFARVGSPWFQEHVFKKASSILYHAGRLYFHKLDGKRASSNGGADSVLVAYGEENSEAIEDSGLPGYHKSLMPELFVVSMTRREDKTWRVIVGESLYDCMSLELIYHVVEKAAPGRVRENKNWKAKVRQTLQMHFTRINRGVWTK